MGGDGWEGLDGMGGDRWEGEGGMGDDGWEGEGGMGGDSCRTVNIFPLYLIAIYEFVKNSICIIE